MFMPFFGIVLIQLRVELDIYRETIDIFTISYIFLK